MENTVEIVMTAQPATVEQMNFANRIMEMEQNLKNGMSFEDALEVFNNG